MQIKHIKTLDVHPSSNRYIKENKSADLENTLVQVIHQTAGVGRRGTPWQSSTKLDLTFSFYVVVPKSKRHIVFMATILAIHKMLSTYNIHSYTKLPNDIYVLDKKIAGILMESTHGEDNEELVVGVGLNVNEPNPTKHDENATSMKALNKDEKYDLEAVLKTFINAYNVFVKKSELIKPFQKSIPFEKLEVTYNNKSFKLKSLNEFFECKIENEESSIAVPCTNLTFKVKK